MNKTAWIVVSLLVAAAVTYLAIPKWMWSGSRSLAEISRLKNRETGEASNDAPKTETVPPELLAFANLMDEERIAEAALVSIAENWDDSYAIMLVEMRGIIENPKVVQNIIKLLVEKAKPAKNLLEIYRWAWRPGVKEHPRYAEFKAILYEQLDKRFHDVFSPPPHSTIKLKELMFLGTHDDRVPSLLTPKMTTQDKAQQLKDKEPVVGVVVDGIAKAFPRKYLSHHEIVRDYVGDAEVLIVDGTLSGVVTAFRSADHKVLDFFASGFVFRSHKVLMDPNTNSLWSCMTGECLVGPKAAPLQRVPVVVTNWKEWRELHPQTWILANQKSTEKINYDGPSPRAEYLKSDDLFPVPEVTPLLRNKDAILVLPKAQPVALALPYCKKNPVAHVDELVVLTSPAGANRVYVAGKNKFVSWDGKATVQDSQGKSWKLTEAALTGPNKETCARFTSYRSYWFAWNVVYPSGKLIK